MFRRSAICLLFCALALTALADGRAMAEELRDGPVVLEIPAGAAASRDFDVDTATRAYLDLLSAEEKARSDAYFEGGYWLKLIGFLYALGVAILLLATGLSARMRDLAERITRRKSLATTLYAVQYIVAVTALSFPLTVYTDYFREHEYGLATQGFGAWLGDQGKGLMVGLILGGLAVVILYAVIRRMTRSWWIGGAVASVMFLLFLTAIAPVFVAPIFNDYKALDEGPVRASILSLARANGIPADNVYWFDASRQTTRISANVSGLFGTTRISLNDNLLDRTSPEEIDAVMGHEIGHYVLNHIWRGAIYMGLVVVLGFVFVKWSFGRVHARWGQRWGISGVGDVAGLPLLSALFTIYFFAMTPVMNSIIRSAESEADIYGLNSAGQPDGFARVAMRLSEYRKIAPGPLEEIIFYDHPSGRTRVEMAMRWKAENLDK